MNFPTRHPLNQTERATRSIGQADVILGLELTDFWGSRERIRAIRCTAPPRRSPSPARN